MNMNHSGFMINVRSVETNQCFPQFGNSVTPRKIISVFKSEFIGLVDSIHPIYS